MSHNPVNVAIYGRSTRHGRVHASTIGAASQRIVSRLYTRLSCVQLNMTRPLPLHSSNRDMRLNDHAPANDISPNPIH